VAEAPRRAWRRILLKLSGEALGGDGGVGLEPPVLAAVAADVAAARALGVEVAIVVGGGNLFRGAGLAAAGLDRVVGDQMGMLATVMNALALRDAFARAQLPACVLSAFAVDGIAERFTAHGARARLAAGETVILAGGTGNPFFTTDTAACLRAIEVGAEVVLKATKVDGVYSADPKRDPGARHYRHVGYQRVLAEGLAVMDQTAIVLCRDHALPIRVFAMAAPGALARLLQGEDVGTLIDGDAT
jgi:uridylate kinase